MRAAMAVAKLQFKLLLHDPWFVLIMFAMPVVVMPLFRGLIETSLQSSGYTEASGAEIVVPGQMVMFGFFVAGTVGFSVFREHGWKTWDRLRASAISPRMLLVGFTLPWTLVHVCYSGALLLTGALTVGLRLNGGSIVAVGLMLVAYSSVVVSIMLLLTATFRTVNQLSGFQNIGAMAFAGLGGALVPFEQLPGWARAVGPLTPAYWAMRGHRSIFLDAGGLSEVALPAAVLFGAAVVLSLVAAIRFKVDETKEFFA